MQAATVIRLPIRGLSLDESELMHRWAESAMLLAKRYLYLAETAGSPDVLDRAKSYHKLCKSRLRYVDSGRPGMETRMAFEAWEEGQPRRL